MKNPFYSKKSVCEYYDKTLGFFLFLYSKEHQHYGMWDKDTKNRKEALENTTKFVVECLNLNEDDIVLDAGCGVGGSSRYIVSNFGIKTIGITISDAQLKKANQLSTNINNRTLLQFRNQDFCQTTFPNEYFTKIFAIESACHDPLGFIREAFRLLKKGGRLVVCDAFQTKKNLTKKEEELLLGVLKGYVLARSESIQDLTNYYYDIGFKNIIFHEKKKELAKSCWKLYRRAKERYPIIFLLTKLKLIPELYHDFNIANYNLKICMDQDFVTYGVFIAEK